MKFSKQYFKNDNLRVFTTEIRKSAPTLQDWLILLQNVLVRLPHGLNVMEPCGGRFRTQLNMTLVSHPRQVMLSIRQIPHKIELNWYPQNWFSFELLLGNERDELYIVLVYPYISFHNYTYNYQENKNAKKEKQASAASKILEHRRAIRSCNLQPSPRPCLEMLKSDLKHILWKWDHTCR